MYHYKNTYTAWMTLVFSVTYLLCLVKQWKHHRANPGIATSFFFLLSSLIPTNRTFPIHISKNVLMTSPQLTCKHGCTVNQGNMYTDSHTGLGWFPETEAIFLLPPTHIQLFPCYHEHRGGTVKHELQHHQLMTHSLRFPKNVPHPNNTTLKTYIH